MPPVALCAFGGSGLILPSAAQEGHALILLIHLRLRTYLAAQSIGTSSQGQTKAAHKTHAVGDSADQEYLPLTGYTHWRRHFCVSYIRQTITVLRTLSKVRYGTLSIVNVCVERIPSDPRPVLHPHRLKRPPSADLASTPR